MEEIMNAMEEYMEAKIDYKERAKNCEYDKGYFLSDEIDRVQKAKEQMESAFNAAVSSIVIRIINNKSYLPL